MLTSVCVLNQPDGNLRQKERRKLCGCKLVVKRMEKRYPTSLLHIIVK
jgi:hypothetical protein